MHNKTILITGVAGLLGSRLAEYIIEKKPGNTVIGIDYPKPIVIHEVARKEALEAFQSLKKKN